MKTNQTSTGGLNREELLNQRLSFESITFLKELIEALPYFVIILNENRQIIFTNNTMLDHIGVNDLRDFLGRAPGEMLNCVVARGSETGCGTSEKCRYCGAVNTIITSLKEDKMVSNEFSLIVENNGTEVNYDYLASSSPFRWKDERFVIFSLKDISSAKRQRLLERIFFHDILNTAANIKGMSGIFLQIEDQDKRKEILKIIGNLSSEIVDDIEAQRQLVAAETGDLIINSTIVETKEILETVINQFENQPAKKCNVRINPESENISFPCDRSLIIRIIKNMVKNALEASNENDTVSLLSRHLNNSIRFEVKNPAFIARNVQMQLFKRNFSTKGSDRGLGTYSMKLLGEKYLKGKINFTTSKEEGTSFYFEIPLS